MKMRFLSVSRLRVWCVLGTILLVVGCASMLGERTVNISPAQLQDAFSRKFPFNNRYLELFDIQLTNPRLTLDPNSQRIVSTMDASIAPPFINQSWKGSFTLSGLLRLDASRNAVVLAEPKLDNFVMDGASGAYTRQITRIGSLVAEQLLRDMPIYTFEPNEFRYGGVNFQPTRINTGRNGLVVTFEPAK